MPAGRPTKYKPEYAERLIEFYSIPPYTIVSDKDGNIIEKANDMPFLVDFAKEIGVGTSTLHDWANRKDKEGKLAHKEFADALKGFHEHRERILATNALKGLYNSTFSIFTAKNILGWRDKLDHNVDGKMEINVVSNIPDTYEDDE